MIHGISALAPNPLSLKRFRRFKTNAAPFRVGFLCRFGGARTDCRGRTAGEGRTAGRTAGDRAFHKADGLPGTEHFIKRPQRISVDFKRHTRLQTLDAIKLFNAVSRQALNLGSATDTKDERDNRRRHECDGEKRSNDRDATALGCCEEFADSAAKIVPPMRSMATDRVDVFGPARDMAK